MFYSIIKGFVLPPGCFFLAILVGCLLVRRHPATGKVVILVSLILFYGVSTPAIGSWLLSTLEHDYAVSPITPDNLPQNSGAGAIVVLSAGIRFADPDQATERVDATGLERLLTGAALHQKTGLPVLVSGGVGKNNKNSNADLMRRTLIRFFNVNDVWLEDKSQTTYENAVFSANALRERNIGKVFLVTQAWHMKRAENAFQEAGLETVAVPTGFTPTGSLDVEDFTPSASALLNSHYGLHEVVGLVWYRLTKF